MVRQGSDRSRNRFVTYRSRPQDTRECRPRQWQTGYPAAGRSSVEIRNCYLAWEENKKGFHHGITSIRIFLCVILSAAERFAKRIVLRSRRTPYPFAPPAAQKGVLTTGVARCVVLGTRSDRIASP